MILKPRRGSEPDLSYFVHFHRYHHYIVKDSDLVKKSKGKIIMSDKKPVSTSTNVEEKTVENGDVSC